MKKYITQLVKLVNLNLRGLDPVIGFFDDNARYSWLDKRF